MPTASTKHFKLHIYNSIGLQQYSFMFLGVPSLKFSILFWTSSFRLRHHSIIKHGQSISICIWRWNHYIGYGQPYLFSKSKTVTYTVLYQQNVMGTARKTDFFYVSYWSIYKTINLMFIVYSTVRNGGCIITSRNNLPTFKRKSIKLFRTWKMSVSVLLAVPMTFCLYCVTLLVLVAFIFYCIV